MKVNLEWLNELVDIEGINTDELVQILSLYSTEIEGVSKVLNGTNLVIGHVLSCVDHPDSDHLHICQVDCGKETQQIVCGAPNIKEGLDVIVALNGCELPGGLKIKKSKIRGVESNGMICSLLELGMEKKYISEEYSDGIFYYTKPVNPGDDPLKALHLSKEVLELGITPNRGDLLSMLGVAYEVSAVLNRPLKQFAFSCLEKGAKNKDLISVTVETDKCLTYYAKVIKDIKIKKSPDWLISRLIAFGIRPINNAVDITNYILALFGQPLHAFDYDLLGNTIVVRMAKENEVIKTLDGIDRVLLPTDIVITDGVKPVALAGVMGGENSSIHDTTKDIVIEAAVFDPISVRKTYTRLDLRSESSVRYEKGVDINRLKLALDYTCYLFETLCEAKVSSGDVYDGIKSLEETEIKITNKEISDYLGVEISKEEVINILKRLNFKYLENTDSEQTLTIYVPTRRMDIKIKADIVEEVGRIFGYENIKETLPVTPLIGKLTDYQKRRRDLKHHLVDMGLIEVCNYSLKENNDEFKYLLKDKDESITLLLPISNERKTLRQELVSSVLTNISYCYNRKIKNCGFFEIGKVYWKNTLEDQSVSYNEEEHICIAISNQFTSTLWKNEKEIADFYLLKGIVNNVLSRFNIELQYEKIPEDIKEMHPLRTALLKHNGQVVGYMGEIHPKYAQDHDLDEVYVCELNLSKLINYQETIKHYTPVSKVPPVERDIALVVKKDVSANSLVETIKLTDKKLISDVIIFDVYEGEKVAKDEKSIAIKIVFTADETLTDELVNNKMNKILKNLKNNHQAELRV